MKWKVSIINDSLATLWETFVLRRWASSLISMFFFVQLKLDWHTHTHKQNKDNLQSVNLPLCFGASLNGRITRDGFTLRCHICTTAEETNVLNLPLSHVYGALIPLLVIAFICLRFYHSWRWLAVPPDAVGGPRASLSCASRARGSRLLAPRRTSRPIICYLWLNILDYWFRGGSVFQRTWLQRVWRVRRPFPMVTIDKHIRLGFVRSCAWWERDNYSVKINSSIGWEGLKEDP